MFYDSPNQHNNNLPRADNHHQDFPDPDGTQKLDFKKVIELERLSKYHLKKGQIKEAFTFARKNMDVTRKMYGSSSFEYRKTVADTIKYLSRFAEVMMVKGRLGEAFSTLKHLDQLTSAGSYTQDPNDKIMVLNLLGCCLRKLGKDRLSLKYLSNAMKLIRSSGSRDHYPETCLNLCGIYQTVGKQEKAL